VSAEILSTAANRTKNHIRNDAIRSAIYYFLLVVCNNLNLHRFDTPSSTFFFFLSSFLLFFPFPYPSLPPFPSLLPIPFPPFSSPPLDLLPFSFISSLLFPPLSLPPFCHPLSSPFFPPLSRNLKFEGRPYTWSSCRFCSDQEVAAFTCSTLMIVYPSAALCSSTSWKAILISNHRAYYGLNGLKIW